MKKAAIIIGSVVLFILLVGFNYLMWENSSKSEDIKKLESETASMDRSVILLSNLYTELEAKYEKALMENNYLQQQNKDNEEAIFQLSSNNVANSMIIVEKNALINELKKIADDEVFNAILQNWIKRINEEDFFAAHNLQGQRNIFETGSFYNMTDMERQFENVERIELVTLNKRMPLSYLRDHYAEYIQYDGVMLVTLKQDEDGPLENPLFVDGENAFTVTFEFNTMYSGFMLSNINMRK
ncbi:MAG: hypothetical protein R6W96_06280 [Clostridia bacterium]